MKCVILVYFIAQHCSNKRYYYFMFNKLKGCHQINYLGSASMFRITNYVGHRQNGSSCTNYVENQKFD